MLQTPAAPPAPVVLDVTPATRVALAPLTAADGSVAGWASVHDGNAVMITVNGDHHPSGNAVIVHVGHTLSAAPSSGTHVPQPELITPSR